MELKSFINKVYAIMKSYNGKTSEVSKIYKKFLEQAEQLKNKALLRNQECFFNAKQKGRIRSVGA